MRDRMTEKVSRTSQRTGIRQMQHEAAGRESRPVDLPVWLQIEAVVVDLGVQVRVKGLDEETVLGYTLVMERDGWGEFPPIIVFRDGEDFFLGAGFHRIEAARRVGLTEVLAVSRPGGRPAAYWFAVTDNAMHGLLLSREDKKEALKRLIGLGEETLPEGQGVPSNRDLAAQLHISHPTVSAWIADLEKTTGKNLPVERIGKDGRAYDPTNIQAANQRRAEEDDARRQILDALAGGPIPFVSLATAVDSPTAAYDAALTALIDEGQVVKSKDASGSSVYRLASAPDADTRDAVQVVREAILAALCNGPLNPSELRYQLGEVSQTIYEVARDSLFAEGLVASDRDLHSGRVTYRVADTAVGEDCGAAESEFVPYPDRLPDSGEALDGRVLAVLENGPLTFQGIQRGLEARSGKRLDPGRLDAALQMLHSTGQIVRQRAGYFALAEAADAPPAPVYPLPAGVQLTPLGVDAHSKDYDAELEAAYRLLVQLEKAVMDSTDALSALLTINGIRTLHRVEPERLAELDTLLDGLKEKALTVPGHIFHLRIKLDTMKETGRPYDEPGEGS